MPKWNVSHLNFTKIFALNLLVTLKISRLNKVLLTLFMHEKKLVWYLKSFFFWFFPKERLKSYTLCTLGENIHVYNWEIGHMLPRNSEGKFMLLDNGSGSLVWIICFDKVSLVFFSKCCWSAFTKCSFSERDFARDRLWRRVGIFVNREENQTLVLISKIT